VENFIDSELIARIRRSDEQAFYLFCNRHWKSLYVQLLKENGSKDEAFAQVKELFAEVWNRRRRLPDITSTVEEYIVANGLGRQHQDRLNWSVMHFADEMTLYVKKLPGLLGILLGDKHLHTND